MTFDPREFFASQNQFAQNSEAMKDERLTSLLLNCLRADKSVKDALFDYAKSSGSLRPRIAHFREMFPRFPVYIGVAQLGKIRGNASLATLFPFKKISQQRFIARYYQFIEEEEAEIGKRGVVVLAIWPTDTPVVLHNLAIPNGLTRVMIRLTEVGKSPLTIEPLNQLPQLLGDSRPAGFNW